MVEPIGLIGTLIAIVQLSSKVVSTCYEYRRSVKNGPQEIVQVLDEVASLRNIVERLIGIVEVNERSSSTQSLQNMAQSGGLLARCLFEVELLKNLLKPRKGWKAKGMALIWPLKQVEVLEHLEVISRLKGTLQLAISTDNAANLIEILTSTRNLPVIQDKISAFQFEFDRMAKDTTYRKIIDWLAAPTFAQKHETEERKRTPGSGQWLLQHEAYQSWQRSSGGVIWLYGFTGCGKTVLCATIIEEVRKRCNPNPDAAIAYIYFDANRGHQFNVSLILRTILTQLMHQTASVPVELLHQFENRDRSRESFDPVLKEVEIAVVHKINELKDVYVVFDALDECTDFDQLHEALQVIKRLSLTSLCRINLLATSRYLPEIEDLFNELNATSIPVEVANVNHDIRLYIRAKFSEDPRLRAWPRALQEEVEKELMNQAQGMFRWADCQLQVLKKCRTPAAIRQTLRTLPRTLDETYTRILTSIDETNVTFAHRLLQWLTTSMRPLRLGELNEALAVDMDSDDQPFYNAGSQCLDMRDILSVCSSLVTTSDGSSSLAENYNVGPDVQVSLAHASVRDFLMSAPTWSSNCAKFAVAQDMAHAYLAKACIGYIIRFDYPLRIGDIDAFPFVNYAAKFWHLHAKGSTVNLDSDLFANLIYRIFDPQRVYYRNWTHLNHIDAPWRTLDLTKDLPAVPSLYTAASLGLSAVCARLVQEGADVNALGGLFGTALQAAAFYGHLQPVQLLLDAGASLEPRRGIWMSPLAAAVSQDQLEVVALLLKRGANIHSHSALYEHRRNPFYVAAQGGHVECCKLLIEYGAMDQCSRKTTSVSALQAATLAGYKDIVALILATGDTCARETVSKPTNIEKRQTITAEVERLDVFQGSMPCDDASERGLEHNSRLGERETVPRLLRQNEDLDPEGGLEKGHTPLAPAARSGHKPIVRDLLSQDADPNEARPHSNVFSNVTIEVIETVISGSTIMNLASHSPLSAAAWAGDLDAIQVLVKDGAEINANRCDALRSAAAAGRLDAFKFLLELGALLPSNPPESTGLMQAAVSSGSASIVKLLLEQGVKSGTLGKGKSSYDHDAIHGANDANGHVFADVVLALIDGGMNINAVDGSSRLLLQAISRHDDLLAAKLVHRGANVNSQLSKADSTPLLDAIYNGTINIIKLLLEKGADPNQHGTINRNQPTFPLLLAADKGDTNIGRVLLAHGAAVNEQDAEDFSALHIAARNGNDAFVKMLLTDFEADQTLRLPNGSLPIHSAAARGNPESMELLLNFGADVNVTNNDGKTPLHWAAGNCRWDNVQLLLDHNARTDVKAEEGLEITPLDLAHIGRQEAERERRGGAADQYTAFPQHQGWSKQNLDKLFERLGQSQESASCDTT